MKLSVIIPTLDRQEELRRCLNSILENSLRPDEVIIVEQGDREKTRKTIASFKPKLNLKLLSLSLKSAAQARNLGAKKAIGELLFFIDDDITLEQTYIEKATRYLSDHPQVMGLQGRETFSSDQGQKNIFRQIISFIFCLNHFKKNNLILRSGHNLSNPTDRITDAQWLRGGQITIRRKVYTDGLVFNPNMIRWSFGEDAWFTYQIYQRYDRGSLKLLPSISWKHFESKKSKINNIEKIKMHLVYRYWFWSQEVYQKKWLNLICYLWSQIGLMLYYILSDKSLKHLPTVLSTYRYLLKNSKKITKEEIDGNDFIFKENNKN